MPKEPKPSAEDILKEIAKEEQEEEDEDAADLFDNSKPVKDILKEAEEDKDERKDETEESSDEEQEEETEKEELTEQAEEISPGAFMDAIRVPFDSNKLLNYTNGDKCPGADKQGKLAMYLNGKPTD